LISIINYCVITIYFSIWVSNQKLRRRMILSSLYIALLLMEPSERKNVAFAMQWHLLLRNETNWRIIGHIWLKIVLIINDYSFFKRLIHWNISMFYLIIDATHILYLKKYSDKYPKMIRILKYFSYFSSNMFYMRFNMFYILSIRIYKLKVYWSKKY